MRPFLTARPTIGVLALQGDVAEHLRVLDALDAHTVKVLSPDQLDTLDGLVVPGGESTTMSKLAVRYGLLEPLRKRIAAGMPAYGTCAGMIMLADRLLGAAADQQTVGGIDMSVRRNAFGRQTESFETAVHIDGLEGDPSTRCSSALPGWSRWGRESPSSAKFPAPTRPVGSSPYDRAA